MPHLGRNAQALRGGMIRRHATRRAVPGARRQRGIALILALWLTVMLTVIASGFAFSMRSEALAARNMISVAQARAAADGAVERTVFELSRAITPQTWKRDGTPHTWQDGDVTLTVSATDEAAKIDLNAANEVLLRSLFSNVGGADPDLAAHIVDALQDWRDADDLKRPNGAEEADYRAAGFKYKPANAQFETVTELARVMGVTPAIFARVADSLTVHSRQAGINPLTASRSVLLALPNATPETVDAYLALRGEALQANQPFPQFPPAQGFIAGAGPVWRVRAVATLSDGVTFAREAVVNPSGDIHRPFVVLAWLDEFTQPPSGNAAAATASADDKDKSNGRP
jgi:general secretion pathway protein K